MYQLKYITGTLAVLIVIFALFKISAAEPSHGDRPNILLLLPDQWRYDWDGRDSKINLPNFGTLAKRGTRFLHAYTASPVCAPSRACLASGREYDDARVPTNAFRDYDVQVPTLYSLLRDQGGYQTFTVGKDDLTKATRLGQKIIGADSKTGRYHQHELGFSNGSYRCAGKMDVVYQPQPHDMYGDWLQHQPAHLSNGTDTTAWHCHYQCMKLGRNCTNELFRDEWYEDTYVADLAVKVLEKTQSNHPQQPWFLQVNFPGPHPPFLVTPLQRKRVENETFPGPADNQHEPDSVTCEPVTEPQKSNQDRCDYAAELKQLDVLVGRILKTIPDPDNTVVCFASDHGEMLGDHGLIGKSVPWEGAVGVPLVCAGPGIQQGVVIEKPFVSTMDLAATFLDYAGVPKDNGMTSLSLKELLATGEDPNYRKIVSSGLQSYPFGHEVEYGYSFRLVVESETSLKYVCCVGNRCSRQPKKDGVYEWLFNVTEDPFEMNPLNEIMPKEMARLRILLPTGFPCKIGELHAEDDSLLQKQVF